MSVTLRVGTTQMENAALNSYLKPSVQHPSSKPASFQVCDAVHLPAASLTVVFAEQHKPVVTPWCLWLRSHFLELHLALLWPSAQPEFAFLVFTYFPYQFSLLLLLRDLAANPCAQVGVQHLPPRVPSFITERCGMFAVFLPSSN